jgi:2,4-dienoyl-CoA reductase-like NADH-dependent reductase (Old Yellow Enzyme family)
MCQYWAHDGVPGDWHLIHLGARAVGGVGLIMTEMTAIEERGRIGLRDVGIWSDDLIEPWQRITRFISTYGSVPGMQIGHAGRKSSTTPNWDPVRPNKPLNPDEGGWEAMAPSPVPLRQTDNVPREMTEQDIASVIAAHKDAARRALEAGFRWLELHCAHGYLHAAFLSPFSNKRTDRWGGSFDNRLRFTLESLRAIREVWPESLPLAVRVSATEWVDGSWTLEDTIAFAHRIKDEGVDLIDCSSGIGTQGGESPRYATAPGWQVPFAERVRRETGIATGAVGVISAPEHADEIIRNGRADLVFIGTALLKNPYWAFHAAQALGRRGDDRLKMPPPYDYVTSR